MPNTWYHVAVTIDPTDAQLWVAGETGPYQLLDSISGDFAGPGGNVLVSEPLGWSIGRGFHNNGVADWADAHIDEVRISDMVLSRDKPCGNRRREKMGTGVRRSGRCRTACATEHDRRHPRRHDGCNPHSGSDLRQHWGIVTAGDPLVGKNIFLVVGNGSDIRSSDSLFVLKSEELFTFESFQAELLVDSALARGQILLGSHGTVFSSQPQGFRGGIIAAAVNVPEPSLGILLAFVGLAFPLRRLSRLLSQA